LHEISHHFLNTAVQEKMQAQAQGHNTCYLPLLLESPSQRWVARVIARGFAGEGGVSVLELTHAGRGGDPAASTGVPHGDADLVMPLTCDGGVADGESIMRRMGEALSHQAMTPRYCVVLQEEFAMPLLQKVGRVLLPVSATLDGVRQAYIYTKQILQQAPEVQVIVLFIDADSEARAHQCFERLALGVQHFLDRYVRYGGWLAAGSRSGHDGSYPGYSQEQARLLSNMVANIKQYGVV
jgi:hypothetical protein